MDPGRTRRPWQWMTGVGAAMIILGGLVAAVTGPLHLARGSWLAAYLVLVGGVAQFTIGRVPHWFGLRSSPRTGWAQLSGWNLGNLGVVVGTLVGAPAVVDVGGLVLLAVLVLLIRDAVGRVGDRTPSADTARRWARWAYLGLLVVLAISVPIGLVLGHLRAG